MKAFLLAGEPSGDRLGAALMDGFDAELGGRGAWTAVGVGGPEMAARGLSSLYPIDDIAVMGVGEILRRYRFLRRRIRETAEAVVQARPDVLITIDAPEFSLRVARLVRARMPVPAVHYVAPSVWAWRPGRAQRMARWVDHVLAILPFEPPYMEAAGMSCDFVGHPVVAQPVADAAAAAAFRREAGLGDGPVVLMLPGSRGSELARHLPLMGAVAARLHAARPEIRFVVPTVAAHAAAVAAAVADWPGAPVVLPPASTSPAAAARKQAAFRAADVALAASGTVTLELAAARTPMVVVYAPGALLRALRPILLKVDTVTLVNLVSGRHAVPEHVGRPRPGPVVESLLQVMADPQAQQAAMAETMRRLGQGEVPPGVRAARSVLDFLARKAATTAAT